MSSREALKKKKGGGCEIENKTIKQSIHHQKAYNKTEKVKTREREGERIMLTDSGPRGVTVCVCACVCTFCFHAQLSSLLTRQAE